MNSKATRGCIRLSGTRKCMRNNSIVPIILIFLCIIIILGIILAINVFPNTFLHINGASAVSITGEADGPTTIYIAAKYDWKLILILSLLLLMLDCIFLAALTILERKKAKKIKLLYKGIIIFLINSLLSILLFPGVFIGQIVITAIMIVVIILTHKIVRTPAKGA